MAKWIWRFSLLVVLTTACGDITVEAPTPAEGLGNGNFAVVLGADWQGMTGSLSLISLDDASSVLPNLEITHSDAVVRSFGGLIYVINRKGADNIQVVDPENFSTLSQFSTGVGTNPQDLAATSGRKAYVTLYEPENNQSGDLAVDDLLVIDPTTGLIEKTIDLTPWTADDGDRYPRASSLLLAGSKLFVAIQDLPGNLSAKPDQPGKLAKIDTETDQVEGVLTLDCRDPFEISYAEKLEKIYVACSDFFDLTSPFGGVEAVNLKTFASEGIQVSDDSLGGWVGGVEIGGAQGFVTVGLADTTENRVVRFSLEDPGARKILYQSRSYLPDIALSPLGELLVCDRDPEKNGILFLNQETGEVTGGPIAVGFPPASIAFLEGPR
ncbi:MAG: hypothetical protein HYY44_09560 [Deltaproteobacteria bacterium]|nr:hypothetical protein [Deltaproteobacteria bacterium]